MKNDCLFKLAKHLYKRLTRLEKQVPETIPTEIISLFEKEINNLKNQATNFSSLCKKLRLSSQEEWLVFLATCLEIEPRILQFLSTHYFTYNKNYLSYRLLSSLLENSTSLIFDSYLVREKLILIDKKSGFYFIDMSLRLSERLLHFLLEIDPVDSRLTLLMTPMAYSQSTILVEQYQNLLKILTDTIKKESLTLLVGEDESLQAILISQLSASLSRKIYFIAADQLPDNSVELYHCIQFLRQEALLRNTLYCFSMHELKLDKKEWSSASFLNYLQQLLPQFCILIGHPDFFLPEALVEKIVLEKPSHQQWKIVWNYFLADAYPHLYTALDDIIEHFELTTQQIKKIAASINAASDNLVDGKILWQRCREFSRKTLSHLATHIPTSSQWTNLILPLAQKNLLTQLIMQVKHRFLIYRTWGLASKEERGLGITALFFGSSGTGKTMAAEAIADKLQLDLYRINLSQIISKYIGETQKNLEEVFSLAEKSCAILLFDEADALFGKRSDIKDSRDRYANMEVNYLLTRMENYRGLSLLTSNLKDNIDNAFLRRFRFVIEFYYPNPAEREILWNKLLIPTLPFKDINSKKLASIDINGASIRNVLINAAFLAAQDKETLSMKHLKKAMQQEFIKLERPLTAEVNHL